MTAHALERARERYGVDLSPSDLWRAVKACRDRKAEFIRNEDEHEMFVCEVLPRVKMVVLYHRPTNKIITVLPRRAAVKDFYEGNERDHAFKQRRHDERKKRWKTTGRHWD